MTFTTVSTSRIHPTATARRGTDRPLRTKPYTSSKMPTLQPNTLRSASPTTQCFVYCSNSYPRTPPSPPVQSTPGSSHSPSQAPTCQTPVAAITTCSFCCMDWATRSSPLRSWQREWSCPTRLQWLSGGLSRFRRPAGRLGLQWSGWTTRQGGALCRCAGKKGFSKGICSTNVCVMQLVREASKLAASAAQTLLLLQDAVYALHTHAAWPYHRIHLLGYGQVCCACDTADACDCIDLQGATAALHLAQQQAVLGQALASCVAVCGTLLPEECQKSTLPQRASVQAPQRPTQVLLVHGTLDEATPACEVDRAEESLSACGMQVARVALARGAGMLRDEAEMRKVMEFWGRVILAPPPPAQGSSLVEL